MPLVLLLTRISKSEATVELISLDRPVPSARETGRGRRDGGDRGVVIGTGRERGRTDDGRRDRRDSTPVKLVSKDGRPDGRGRTRTTG